MRVECAVREAGLTRDLGDAHAIYSALSKKPSRRLQ